jgi:enterochelin esterase-like enzyme
VRVERCVRGESALSLQGVETLVAFGLLLAVVMIGTAVAWPRLSGRDPRHWLARIGLILLCQVSALVLVAIVVNRLFDFYVSWGELMGLQQRAPVPSLAQIVAPADTRLDQRVHPVATAQSWPRLTGKGRIVPVRITGSRTGINHEAQVYLPPQYDRPQSAHARYPVLLALAGYPSAAGALTRQLGLAAALDGLIDRGAVRPMIVVMMSPTVAPPRDTECADVPGGPAVETFLSADVPAWVRPRYRVDQRSPWGVLGLSTGGFCSVKLGMRHPEVFGAAVSLSGHLHTLVDGTTGRLYANRAEREANDPLWRVHHLPPPPTRLLLTATRTELGVYPQVVDFRRQARGPLRADTLILPAGGHNFGVWRQELPRCLEWLSLWLGPSGTSGAPRDTG